MAFFFIMSNQYDPPVGLNGDKMERKRENLIKED